MSGSSVAMTYGLCIRHRRGFCGDDFNFIPGRHKGEGEGKRNGIEACGGTRALRFGKMALVCPFAHSRAYDFWVNQL